MTEVWDRIRPVAAGCEPRRRTLARWAGRGLTSCLDQGVVSGVNFAANVLLARPAPSKSGGESEEATWLPGWNIVIAEFRY